MKKRKGRRSAKGEKDAVSFSFKKGKRHHGHAKKGEKKALTAGGDRKALVRPRPRKEGSASRCDWGKVNPPHQACRRKEMKITHPPACREKKKEGKQVEGRRRHIRCGRKRRKRLNDIKSEEVTNHVSLRLPKEEGLWVFSFTQERKKKRTDGRMEKKDLLITLSLFAENEERDPSVKSLQHSEMSRDSPLPRKKKDGHSKTVRKDKVEVFVPKDPFQNFDY